MTARKTFVGLSLICALAFCAFGAASASAQTTAFTCVEKSGNLDFSDAHCDKKVEPGKGTFGHVAIEANKLTEWVSTNNKTGAENSSWILKGKIAATPIEITCATIEAMGEEENNTTTADIKGSGTLNAHGNPISPTGGPCTLLAPSTQMEKCTVTVAQTKFTLTGAGMGINFVPVEEEGKKIFAKITISGATCPAGIVGTFTVEGTAFAHGENAGGVAAGETGGATLHFTHEETTKTLIFAGNPAGIEGTATVRMGPTGTPGNPLSATTM